LSVWDLSHQELNNNLQFLNLDSESFGSNFRTSSEGLDKSGLGLRVFQLNSLNSTQVVKVPRVLVVGNILREGSFDDELSGLLIQILTEIGSQDNISDSSLAYQIFS